MILYLDTSDLFKIYIWENGSSRVESNVANSDRLASSRVAYVEMRAALAAALRGNRLGRSGSQITQLEYDSLVRDFEREWRLFIKVNLSPAVIRTAGALAERQFLRGSDAVHLSSAIALRSAQSEQVWFSVNDAQLKAGAIAEGFVVV